MKSLFQNNKSVQHTIGRQEALQCIPSINSSIYYTETETGEIMLEYPLQIKPFFKSLFERFQKSREVPTKKLQLDEMGSLVWKEINGKNSVQMIIDKFAHRYGITLQESEKSVTTFLVELGKRGIIAMS